jgi:pyruvate/2-oxoacid:ferredoxin oxidoreductase alpha subunit
MNKDFHPFPWRLFRNDAFKSSGKNTIHVEMNYLDMQQTPSVDVVSSPAISS